MIIAIDIIPIYKDIKEEIVNDLFWYDTNSHILHRWKGSKLGFKYQNGQTIAYPIKEYKVAHKIDTNEKDILDWIENTEDISIIGQDNKEIVISFPDNKQNEIEDELYEKRFRYEIINYAESQNSR